MRLSKNYLLILLILVIFIPKSNAELYDRKEGLVFDMTIFGIPSTFDYLNLDITYNKITIKESGVIELEIHYEFGPPYMIEQQADLLLNSYMDLLKPFYQDFNGTPNFILFFPDDSYKLNSYRIYEDDKIIKGKKIDATLIKLMLTERYFQGTSKVLGWRLDTTKKYKIQLFFDSNIEINNINNSDDKHLIEFGQLIPFGRIEIENINVVLPDNVVSNNAKLSFMKPTVNKSAMNLNIKNKWGYIEENYLFEGQNNLNLAGTHDIVFKDYYIMNISIPFQLRKEEQIKYGWKTPLIVTLIISSIIIFGIIFENRLHQIAFPILGSLAIASYTLGIGLNLSKYDTIQIIMPFVPPLIVLIMFGVKSKRK